MIPIKKVSEGRANVVDLIEAGKVDLIINTPRSKQGRRDGYEIRRAAVDFSVPSPRFRRRWRMRLWWLPGRGGVGVAAVRGHHEGN